MSDRRAWAWNAGDEEATPSYEDEVAIRRLMNRTTPVDPTDQTAVDGPIGRSWYRPTNGQRGVDTEATADLTQGKETG